MPDRSIPNDWDRRRPDPQDGVSPATPAEIEALGVLYGFTAEFRPGEGKHGVKTWFIVAPGASTPSRNIYGWRPIEDWIACLKDMGVIKLELMCGGRFSVDPSCLPGTMNVVWECPRGCMHKFEVSGVEGWTIDDWIKNLERALRGNTSDWDTWHRDQHALEDGKRRYAK